MLVRWFPAELAPSPSVAAFLDVILYSREQIRKEAAAMGREDDGEEAPWGIISVKAQDVAYELPMQPITVCISVHVRMALMVVDGSEGWRGVGLQGVCSTHPWSLLRRPLSPAPCDADDAECTRR